VIRLLEGDCRVTLPRLPEKSVHACITSPPYYGLRDYGLPPLVWGGVAEHAHDFAIGPARMQSIRNGQGSHGLERHGVDNRSPSLDAVHLETQAPASVGLCDCGAWLGSLGLEPTPDLYIEHMVEVFREVRRVLRDDGVLWLNLGDSYAGSGKGGHNPEALGWIQNAEQRQGFINRAFTPAGFKPKDLLMMPFRVAMALQADGWWLRSVIPWLKRNCLSGGTRVYVRCQKGDMPMTVKDLARLDPKTCKLWNGERWTQVVSVWDAAQDEGDPIEIELRSGERIGCTPEHRWPTERGLLPAFALRVGDVLKGGWLPKPDTRQPAALEDEDVGWFVGLYIAEGSRSKATIQIASHAKETERFQRLCRIAEAFDGTCRAHLKGANGMTINLTGQVLNAIIDQYVGGRLADDKHLTNRCWMRSNEFLSAVLDGYLHGDGHYDAKNRRWRLGFTRNYAWEGDLRTIAARLNLDLRLKMATVPYADRQVPIFRGSLRFERTTKLWTKNEREIMRIGHSRGRKFWDLAVEDDPHTFALASGVLTHNSMPESVTDRPATSVEYVFLLAKSARYYWDADAVRKDMVPESASRYEYAFGGVKNAALVEANKEGVGDRTRVIGNRDVTNGRNRRNSDWFFESWQGLLLDEQADPLALVVNPQPFKGSHFATFPPKLVEPMVKASTRPGDTILDPFFGAGTVGLVADRLGRHAIGCELNVSYATMGTQRIVGDAPMFAEVAAD